MLPSAQKIGEEMLPRSNPTYTGCCKSTVTGLRSSKPAQQGVIRSRCTRVKVAIKRHSFKISFNAFKRLFMQNSLSDLNIKCII